MGEDLTIRFTIFFFVNWKRKKSVSPQNIAGMQQKNKQNKHSIWAFARRQSPFCNSWFTYDEWFSFKPVIDDEKHTCKNHEEAVILYLFSRSCTLMYTYDFYTLQEDRISYFYFFFFSPSSWMKIPLEGVFC